MQNGYWLVIWVVSFAVGLGYAADWRSRYRTLRVAYVISGLTCALALVLAVSGVEWGPPFMIAAILELAGLTIGAFAFGDRHS